MVEQNYYIHTEQYRPPGDSDDDVNIYQRKDLPPFRIRRAAQSDSPPVEATNQTHSDLRCTQRIGIVGAGCAGLYLAMLLTLLGFKNVDIYEAAERLGGRVYTYEFPDKNAAGTPIPKAKHNYYDIGAMRFPCIPGMQP